MPKDFRAGQILGTIDASTGASIQTDFYPLKQYGVTSIQAVWSGFDANDSTMVMETTDSNGVAWDEKSGTTIAVNSASGSESLSLAGNATSQAIRFNFTRGGSTTAGTVIIYGTLKE